MSKGIVITSFENVSQTIENIGGLRSLTLFKNSPIVVVTTSEKQSVINSFGAIHNSFGAIHNEVIRNCPGNSDSDWEPPNTQTYHTKDEQNSWRAKFLPFRILKSMSVGFNKLHEIGCHTALHIHSDSFIKPEFEPILIQETEELKDKFGIWDSCIEDTCGFGALGTHIHPAPIHLNLTECHRYGIIDFHKAFHHETFQHHNFISIESLIGCWANFCISKESVTQPEHRCCDEFYEKFRIRCQRYYHGDFPHIMNF